ncbi:FAD-dependent monooxygenase [Actinomycetospora endophytica]|uniref:FAD-dependent monooxygenase n=1 Tax=Actinomycetospora endophytica TaxID=2291215 RepID=A0ABS8PES1_9PSEU|nr:NAD(P)/FAD-dependent oxidoreductase [Actinomycetospora endophytica]MCD2196761.1 FAD-dependent monooxygenase [Actinomycetospora endophytica]
MRVVVIGAGLGGLTLAHGLRSAGIEVAVYERGSRSGPQPASYGIHVNRHGNRALHACLPAGNWALFDQGAVPAPDVVRFRDARLTVLTDLEQSAPTEDVDPVAHRRAVRRDVLHSALRLGLDAVLHWEKTFESFARRSDGTVRVRFADGTWTDGDLLVGADGSNSRVRHQYLPDLVRHELGILNVAGRLPLDHPAARALPAGMTDGSVNNVVPGTPGWLFASAWPAADRNGAGRPVAGDDVLVWAYAAARTAYPDGVESLDGEALRHWVGRRVARWDPRVAAMVAGSAPDTVAPVSLRTMGRLRVWPASTVTLLGDAVHSMTPMAGVGANTALRDADALRRALTDPGPDDLVARVGTYEEQMRGYANEALAVSTRNARNAASTRRLPRLAFRALLSAGEAVPPIKRRVFPATRQAVPADG